jgi:hypothetical protein
MEGQQSGSKSFDWKEFSQRTWVVITAGFLLPPLGVFLSWQKPDWSPRVKWIATGLMGVLTLFRIVQWPPFPGITLSLTSIAFGWLIKEWTPRVKWITTGLMLVAILTRSGFEADKEKYKETIDLVKNGYFTMDNSPLDSTVGLVAGLEDGTIGHVVNRFMGSASWSAGETADADTFVNVTGTLTKNEKTIRARVQFIVDDSQASELKQTANKISGYGGTKDRAMRNLYMSKAFRFHALEFNGVPQDGATAAGLFKKMIWGAVEERDKPKK